MRLMLLLFAILLLAAPAHALTIEGSWAGTVSVAPGSAPGQGSSHPEHDVVEHILVGDAAIGTFRFELDDTTHQIRPDPAGNDIGQAYMTFTVGGLSWSLQGAIPGGFWGSSGIGINPAGDQLLFSMNNQIGFTTGWNFPATGFENDEVSLELDGNGSWLPAGFTWDQYPNLDPGGVTGGTLRVRSFAFGPSWNFEIAVTSFALPEPTLGLLVPALLATTIRRRSKR